MAMTERVGREAFVRQQHAIMGRRDHSATLVAIRVPTLVLCGRQDALTPLVDHQAMAAGISDSRLVVVEDCGHLATIERPAPVHAALRRPEERRVGEEWLSRCRCRWLQVTKK